MKRTIAFSIFATIIVAFIGCGTVAKMTEKKPTVGPLAKIMVFQGELLPGQAGKARGEALLPTLTVGGSIVLTAMGRDASDNDIGINPTWTPTNPAIVEITPAVGPTVTIKALRKGRTDLLIEFSGITKKFETIYVE